MSETITRYKASAVIFILVLVTPLVALSYSDAEPLGIAMENYDYPYPVQFFPLEIEGKDVRMAYMDVPPLSTPNGKTVVLMHGKNFFGAYWDQTIDALAGEGFRVIVPDQIGFGKSSKPDIHYSFHMLARNTRLLLDTLGVDSVAVVGHSMGGMLATRFALMYPVFTTSLTLENPIGLEDYRFKVPYTPLEQVYAGVLAYTLEGLRNYHKTYYVEWKDEYETYVRVHWRWTLSGEYPRLAWASALTFEMVYTQPVVHEFGLLQVPTLLVIGQEDRTTLGRGSVAPEVLATLGQYPELGKAAAEAIPNATLVELPRVGHIPHFEATERWLEELLTFLQ